MKTKLHDPVDLIANCRPRDTVVIRTPQDQLLRGKAVICSGTHVAINLGGKHGTPGVATPANVVSVRGMKSEFEGYSGFLKNHLTSARKTKSKKDEEPATEAKLLNASNLESDAWSGGFARNH